MSVMNTGIYLFCLTPPIPLPEISGNGIDGKHPLFIEVIGGVAAVMAEVELDEFTGPEAIEKMTDLSWVAPRALRHEEVILAAMGQGPVLPVRFSTVFSSLAAAAESLLQHQEGLKTFFKDIACKQEWILKGFANLPQARARLTAERLAAEKNQLEGLSPGKRYFFEQKTKGAVDKETNFWLKGIGEKIETLARGASVGFNKCRVQSREASGRSEEMFFHGALLLSELKVAELVAMVDTWNECQKVLGLQIELSGPWPPYHFAPLL